MKTQLEKIGFKHVLEHYRYELPNGNKLIVYESGMVVIFNEDSQRTRLFDNASIDVITNLVYTLKNGEV